MILQVAKLDPVSRAAGMDCECPLYRRAYLFAGIKMMLGSKGILPL